MLITENERLSRIATCIESAHHFLLAEKDATEIVEAQLRCIGENWSAVCDEADLGQAERNLFWGRQFLNPYAFTSLQGRATELATLGDEVRRSVQ